MTLHNIPVFYIELYREEKRKERKEKDDINGIPTLVYL